MNKPPALPASYGNVCNGIVELLQAARQAAARNVNALMTASYWEIGRRIVEAEQQGKRRAGYGEQLIERLSLDLTQQFGRGFSRQNLWQMRQFYEAWTLDKILQTPSGEFEKSQTPSGELPLTVKRRSSHLRNRSPARWLERAPVGPADQQPVL